MKRIICFVKGHMSRISECPFTGYTYDVCDRCQTNVIIGRRSQSANINHHPRLNLPNAIID